MSEAWLQRANSDATLEQGFGQDSLDIYLLSIYYVLGTV